MAYIRKRGKSWHAVVRRRGYPDQSKSFKFKADADAWAHLIESEMERGEWRDRSDAGRTTLKAALDRYLVEITPHKKGAKQETNRIRALQRTSIASHALGNIRGYDVAALRDERLKSGLSASTINNELILLSHVFTIARSEWGMESLQNPVANVRRPRLPKGRDRRISLDEEKRLEEAAAKVHPLLPQAIAFAVSKAPRRGELCAMRREHVSGNVWLIPETKNGEARKVPLTVSDLAILKELPKRLDGFVWPWAKSPDVLTHLFTDACRLAGIPNLRFHDLRHEGTSRLFEAGLNIMEVAAITGHKTLQVLKRYTHLRPEDLLRKIESGARDAR